MIRIDFYIIKTLDPDADWLFSAKLIEKAYQLGHQIYVLCENEDMAIAFDEFLWQFNPDSFIPHHLFNEGPTPPAPVQIGFEHHQPQSRDILVNLMIWRIEIMSQSFVYPSECKGYVDYVLIHFFNKYVHNWTKKNPNVTEFNFNK
jgi:DNA polymerase IIIc chi subunit